MRKVIVVLISLMLILAATTNAQKKKKKIKEAEFESVLVEVIDVTISKSLASMGELETITTLRFENGAVVPALKVGILELTYAIWFIGKRYKVWTDSSTMGYRAELVEEVGIELVDQEVRKRLSKEAKK
jgi:hypothetical protein